MKETDPRKDAGRRRFLGAASMAALASVSGCLDVLESDTEEAGVGQIGSGRSPFGDRDLPGGTAMAEMPEMDGELTVYSGRSEPLVEELIGHVEGRYDGLTLDVRYGGSAEFVGQLEEEGETSPADVFYSVNAGALGALSDRGLAASLPDDVLDLVREEFRDPDGEWVGTSGRARTVPYNTDELDEDDVPDDVMAFPETEAFRDAIGWAPAYGSFQAFVTAMRIIEGEDATKEWLEGMLDLGVEEYHNEFQVAQAVADGDLVAGFANHYYGQRVLAGDRDAPLGTAFTEGDAGAVFNVAGACTLASSDEPDLAANFVRHLLSAEAQDYFARRTFEYPLIPEVDPVGDLPTIDELNPPSEIDLTELSNLEETIELMREVGVL